MENTSVIRNDWALISLVIPVYNVERYLRECLDSVLAQTYRNLEVILVDDGSTDSSGEICDTYARTHGHFHVIHKTNAGLGMARNTGMHCASGSYIMFLDSDDYLEPLCVEQLYCKLMENHVEMCKGGFQRISNDKKVFSTTKYSDEVFVGSRARTELAPRIIGSAPDRHDSIEMSACCTLYRASHIHNHGICFPSERELISEDMVFNIDYLQYANGACTISEIGYNYRANPVSLTRCYRTDRFSACRKFYCEMKRKLEDLGYDDSVILRLQRIFFVFLKRCISQEYSAVSGKTAAKGISSIRTICADSLLQSILSNYPTSKLGLKQRVFLEMLRYQSAGLLYIMAALRII